MKRALVALLASFPILALAEPSARTVPKSTLSIQKIRSADDFESLAEASAGVIRQGTTIKALIDNRDYRNPEVYFLNANYCPTARCESAPREATSHYAFAKKKFGNLGVNETEYMQNSYFTTTVRERKFFDARVQRFRMKINGVDTEFYGIRFIERDVISGELIQHAVTALSKALNIPGQNLAFLINSETQRADEAWLTAHNVTTLTMEQVLSGVDFIGLNPGVAYGFLRFDPENEEDLEPYDIPVFQSLPLDLSVVAGTISTEFQDVGSHVNLKSKERGTPNMVARKAEDIENLKRLNGSPVKLTVKYGSFKIEQVTERVVFDEYRRKTDKPWKAVAQSDETRLIHFDDMCPRSEPAKCLEQSRAFGGKVVGLGFLAHPKVAGMESPLQRKFGYRLTPMGFGVPLTNYNQFMKEAFEKDSQLKDTYNQLINAEMGLNGAAPLTAPQRRELIAKLKAGIMAAAIPQGLYRKIHAEMLKLKQRVQAAYPGVELDKLKIRSSSNAEDIEGFNGAGLHDSYSAKISKSDAADNQGHNCRFEPSVDEDTGLEEEDVKPKSLACAIKAAYASLWNVRAVRERSYKRFDHRTASMGLSIQTAYKFREGPKIKSNSVMITRVLGADNVYGQQLSTQVGNGLVTNPVKGTKSELVVISFDVNITEIGLNVLQYAKPKADQPVMTSLVNSREETLKLSEIARAVEVKYCEAKKEAYFPGRECKFVINSQAKKLALDMEFKLFDNGEVLIKQVRTFSGR